MYKGLALKQLKSRLNFDIIAKVMHDISKSDLDLVVSHVCIPPFAQWRANDSLNFSSYGQLMGVFFASILYLMQSPSLNSDFVSVKQ